LIELPEAYGIAKQLNNTIMGKYIVKVLARHTPHKLAWYYGDPSIYSDILCSKSIGKSCEYGGLVNINVEDAAILFGDGVNIRFYNKGDQLPSKHQLLVEFEDGSALAAWVQMYGGVGSFIEGTLENPYYRAGREKPSPLSDQFDKDYFYRIISAEEDQKLSLKGLLATGQRIPGLGNGVLQDILFNACLHPKKKASTLTDKDRDSLYNSIKSTLWDMATKGGRDTETDLFGNHGNYQTILSKNTVNKPCPVCGTIIKKEAYMGGSIYYCSKCQVL
jgi:formamidopyrimidine-DNA glycosylase